MNNKKKNICFRLLLNIVYNMQPVTKTSSQPRSPTEATTHALPSYKCGWLYKRGINYLNSCFFYELILFV